MEHVRPPFPIELWEANYDYPEELFQTLPQDNRDAREEKVRRMAKYAVIKSLNLKTSEERTIRAAKGEFEERTFMASVLRIAHNRSALGKAEVEIEAQILGVTEYIWPFDPKKMQTAIEAEARGEPISGLDAEVVPNAFDDVGNDDLRFDEVVINA